MLGPQLIYSSCSLLFLPEATFLESFLGSSRRSCLYFLHRVSCFLSLNVICNLLKGLDREDTPVFRSVSRSAPSYPEEYYTRASSPSSLGTPTPPKKWMCSCSNISAPARQGLLSKNMLEKLIWTACCFLL
jgi:hypothetical protein